MLYDLSTLRKLTDNDEAFIIDMLQTFKRTVPPIVARMEEEVVQDKIEILGREAHKMIPGVSFLGARDLEKLLVTIEENAKKGIGIENMPSLVSQVKERVNALIAAFETDFKLE